MQNGTFAGEIDMSDEQQSMELLEKSRHLKADSDGFVIEDDILYFTAPQKDLLSGDWDAVVERVNGFSPNTGMPASMAAIATG